MNDRLSHQYSKIYPDFADHWYMRSAKLDPNDNPRGVLMDYKVMQTCLVGKRGTQMAQFLPLRIAHESILKDRPEFDWRRSPKKHLYWNRLSGNTSSLRHYH